MRLFLIFSFLILSSLVLCGSIQFHPAPYENSIEGRNSHVYLPRIGSITYEERVQFIQELAQYAQQAEKTWGIPASALIGMAVVESGYGTTQTAYYANNLFGVKAWGRSPDQAWQLVGQPDEDFEQPVPIVAYYGPDRIVYEEENRRDNWYRKFSSYKQSVDYVAGKLLQNQRYAFAKERYEDHMRNGWSLVDASKQYLFDIAEAGYNHQGGAYYRKTVGKVIDQWDLTQYDQRSQLSPHPQTIVFQDMTDHWAKEAVQRLSELGIISGYPDGTFRPNETINGRHLLRLLNESRNYIGMPALEDHAIQQLEHFRYEDEINRATAAQLFAITMDLEPNWAPLSFRDSTEINNENGRIGAVVERKLIIGYEDGTFRPNERVSRAQAAVMIARLLQFSE